MSAPSSRPQVDLLIDDRTRRSPFRRRAVPLAVIAVLAVGGVVSVGRAQADEAPAYRTATVARHDVAQTLTAVATIEPVSEATVAFPVAGTVSGVSVAVGDTVAVGQVLATLDAADLVQALHTRQAELANAQLDLADALTAIADAATTTTSTSTTTTAAPRVTTPTMPAAPAAPSAVATASAAADEALAAADQACAAVTDAATAATCSDALAAVRVAQQAMSTALDDLAATTTAAASTAAPTSTAPAPSTAPTQSTGTPTQAARTVSSEQLIAFQKAVDAAESKVAVAIQSVAQATVVSPIAGTVVDVGLAVGDAIEAASSTANITIAGDGGYEVTTSVSIDDLPDLALGQAATVVPDGTDTVLAGSVVSIATVPESTDSTDYRVVVGLTDPTDADLGNGATAEVVIVTASTASALAVPTSAVTARGDRHSVEVVDGTTTSTKQVGIGAVGPVWTEITSGLDAGDRVVLADLGAALPGVGHRIRFVVLHRRRPGAADGSTPVDARTGPVASGRW